MLLMVVVHYLRVLGSGDSVVYVPCLLDKCRRIHQLVSSLGGPVSQCHSQILRIPLGYGKVVRLAALKLVLGRQIAPVHVLAARHLLLDTHLYMAPCF